MRIKLTGAYDQKGLKLVAGRNVAPDNGLWAVCRWTGNHAGPADQ